jgi:NhaA family Na+:H+ antiporter
MGLAKLPDGATWIQLYGVAVLGGIGFTMSLFIGTLAFAGPEQGAAVRLGVLAGSIASALFGYFILRMALSDAATQAGRRRRRSPGQVESAAE